LEPRATAPQKKRWERAKNQWIRRGFQQAASAKAEATSWAGSSLAAWRLRAAGAAFLGAGAERFVDDRLDGARAPAAFGIAAEATVNLFRISRQVRGCTYGIADIVVAQNIAGTDDHETDKTLGDATSSIFKSATRCKRKSRIFKQFQTDAVEILE